MKTLICTLCVTEKPVNEFYKNKGMPSGYANQCKECVKARTKAREEILRQDPKWVEKEKIRAREKYKRLGYDQKQKVRNEKRPWVNTSDYRNANRDFKASKTETVHHWNYNHLKDVFILDKKLHRRLHKYLELDDKTLCFKTIEGTLLYSKRLHAEYIEKIKKIEKL